MPKALEYRTREFFLTDSLHELWHKRLSEEERATVGDMLEFYVAQFRQLAVEQAGNPLGIAAGIHEAIETAVATDRAKNPYAGLIQCQKGCPYCCEKFVGVMPQEARLLWASAQERGLPIDDAQLHRQATATESTWKDLAPADRRCPFLVEDGTCGVYEQRPFACRKYFVISPPMTCKTATHSWRWIAPMAEIIATAAYTVFGISGMATALIETGAQPDA
ncbi:YkgJ family cysteine cluster protein [Nitrospira sp. Nam74]